MPSIVINFEVHQPMRLKWFGIEHKPHHAKPKNIIDFYFDHAKNKHHIGYAAEKCYTKANNVIMEQIERFKHGKKKFKVSYSISGVFLEQLEKYGYDNVIDSFKQLYDTGCVEFISETYYHSLSSLWGTQKTEFVEQIKEHRQILRDLFRVRRFKVFRNTEFLYNNTIAKTVKGMGYEAIFTEGCEKVLGWRSPNYVYTPPPHASDIKILLRNYKLSDDIGYRFSARWWNQWPLLSEKYATWLSACQGQCLNLCMDYETFGEHQWEETGIFEFLKKMPEEVLKYDNLDFKTPTEITKKHKPVGVFDVSEYNTISWADLERDTSAWLGNKMQRFAFNELKNMEEKVKKTKDKNLLKAWKFLQNSDHLYYACTKGWGDGDVHCYFSPYTTPMDGFLNYMTIINDLKHRVEEKLLLI